MAWPLALAWTIRPPASTRNMPALRPSRVSANVAASAVLRSISPADQHRAANMRDDEPHAPARLVVDEAIPLVPEDAEQGSARR